LDTVRTLLEYIDGALAGRGYYHVTANIRGEDAESVAQKIASNPITRGLQGPTIAPIYDINGNDGQWYTVTIIIASRDLLRGMEHLRAIGGTQTVVTPVRYVFLEHSPTYAKLLENLRQMPGQSSLE
jgi:ATP phosphoribosyltransferase